MGEQQCFLYKLGFPDGERIEFPIVIDKLSCTLVPDAIDVRPDWTQLEYQQCGNCTLNKASSPYCPVAVNLMPVIRLCSCVASYQTVQVEVSTAERTIHGDTTMQRALSSILGLVMATSPCPHTEFLKPMAHFHLPLASEEETIYRVTSMFLLTQYFRSREGLEFSMELDQLQQKYKNLQIVNRALAKRLSQAASEDATLNAVILLDLLSQSVTWSIEDGLEEIRYLFNKQSVEPPQNGVAN